MAGCLDDDQVLAWVGGELDGDAAAAVIDHLDRCDACRRLVAAASPTADPGPDDLGAVAGALVAVGDRIGRFVVLERVGRGGMGEVYAAWDPDLDRRVALKLVRADMRADHLQARLKREAQALARLSHPAVITIYEVGAIDHGVFLAMELMDGGTLRQWLRDAPRGWAEVVDRFVRAGTGLAAAHGAGLVHRDFKADNVLLARDGRQRVTDFGLARALEPARAPVADGVDLAVAIDDGGVAAATPATITALGLRVESPLDVTLTSVGAVIGTPAYMAPEQLRTIADARSDQFSFCASLYQALYGELPFPGATLGEYVAAIAAGRVRAAPRGTRVPPAVRAIVVRGLAAAPAARFPTMPALLDALRATRRRRRAPIIATAAVLAVIAGGLGFALVGGGEPPCIGAEHKLDGVWDAPRRRALHDAFAATRVPFARDAATATTATLDAWGHRWIAMRTEACMDTTVRGLEPERVMELRDACLDDRLEETRAVIDLLIGADADLVERAPHVAGGLTSLSSCGDVRALARRVPPRDRAQADAARALDKEIDRAVARYAVGQQAALETMKALAMRARQVGYVPTWSTATYQVGAMENDQGDGAGAIAALQESAQVSIRGRDDQDAEIAWAKLASVAAGTADHQADAPTWLAYAQAAEASRGVKPDDVTSELMLHSFFVAYARGDLPGAEQAIRRRLAIDEQLPDHDEQRRDSLGNLAVVMSTEGHPAEAYPLFLRVLDESERAFGRLHPTTITARENAGLALIMARRYADALPLLEDAHRTRATIGGEDGREAAVDLGLIARALAGLGREDEADADARRGLAALEHALGPDAADLREPVAALGALALQRGHAAEAVALLERALRLGTAANVDAGDAAPVQFDLARALAGSGGDLARARTLATTARDAYRDRDRRFGGDNRARADEIDRWLASPAPAR